FFCCAASVLKSSRIQCDELAVEPTLFDKNLENACQKREIATGVDRVPIVRELGPEYSRFSNGWDPVAFHPRLEVRINDRDACAGLLRVVQILHRYGLVVRRIRSEEDDQVGADPVGIRTRRRTMAQRTA